MFFILFYKIVQNMENETHTTIFTVFFQFFYILNLKKCRINKTEAIQEREREHIKLKKYTRMPYF